MQHSGAEMNSQQIALEQLDSHMKKKINLDTDFTSFIKTQNGS